MSWSSIESVSIISVHIVATHSEISLHEKVDLSFDLFWPVICFKCINLENEVDSRDFCSPFPLLKLQNDSVRPTVS